MDSDYKSQDIIKIIQSAQKDNDKALEELIRREQKSVYAMLYYLNVAPDEIMDLTQEILLKIAKNIKQLRNPQTFRSWLNQIIIRQFYDNLRKIRRSCPKISLADQEVEERCKNEILDLSSNPSQKAIGNELDIVIKDSISRLAEPFKIAIVMRELQGLSYEQIADATKSNIGTVKSRIARARGKLKEYIKPYIH
jgi:RNA polymerase sigma-70 factor (ECF subfamily)